MIRVATLLFIVACANPVAAASPCHGSAESSSVRLIAVHPTATEELSATREEMDHIAALIGATAASREVHPLMLIAAQAGTHVDVTHNVIKGAGAGGAPYFCDIPTSTAVFMGVFKRQAILYKKAAANPCVRRALIDHFDQHSKMLDRTIEVFIDKHRDELSRNVKALAEKPAPDEPSATGAFETGLAALVGPLYRKLERDVAHSRLEAETPAALAQLRNACNGELQRLELDFTAPDGRRTSLLPADPVDALLASRAIGWLDSRRLISAAQMSAHSPTTSSPIPPTLRPLGSEILWPAVYRE